MEDKTTLTYAEVLAAVEAFMVGSGIRQFCSEVCRGQCCKNCKAPCYEERRLNCSAFVCGVLNLYLTPIWKNSNKLMRGCFEVVTQAVNDTGQKSSNPHFVVHTTEIKTRCVFSASLIETIPPREQWPVIAQRMRFLTDQTQIEVIAGGIWHYNDPFVKKVLILLKNELQSDGVVE